MIIPASSEARVYYEMVRRAINAARCSAAHSLPDRDRIRGLLRVRAKVPLASQAQKAGDRRDEAEPLEETC
jgi:hypothetical protein